MKSILLNFLIVLFCILVPRILHSEDLKHYLESTPFFISSSYNAKCLDLSNWSQNNGESIQLWKCTHNTNQEFRLVSTSDKEVYEVVNTHSRKCLDIAGISEGNGALLTQWECIHGKNQKFRFIKDGNTFRIQTFSGKCLDIADWNRTSGARIHQWDCSGWANQRFHLEPSVKTESDPLVLTFQNNPHQANLKNIVASLKRWGWDFEVIGQGLKWKGFGTKFINYALHLKTLKDKNRIVVLVDSTDLIANGAPEEFIKTYLRISNYKNTHHRIVISAEKACCVTPMSFHLPGDFVQNGMKKSRAIESGTRNNDGDQVWKTRMEAQKNIEGFEGNGLDYKFLNSGMIVGRAKDLIEMFDFLKTESNEDDQALASEYFLRFPEKVLLDYNNVLFSNSNFWAGFNNLNGCYYSLNEYIGRFVNTESDSFPFFIQTPAKHWVCYDHLVGLSKFNHDL